MNEWVVPLETSACQDPLLVGGKAAQLSRLSQGGFPVPEAFVITVDAFHYHFEGCDPLERPERPEFSPELAQRIDGALQALTGEFDQPVAVRSSAVGEDGLILSYAGQHSTYYYVTRDDLVRAVTNCWLSLWSDSARAYRVSRADTALESGGFAMAVIVQRMIQAERSGVCFSADPTGQYPEHSLLEASWGLGAALVDGRVSPDRFFIAPDNTIRETRIGRKRFKVAENLNNPLGNRLEPVPAHQQRVACLQAEEVHAIAALARRAEKLFGSAQDIEWAFQGDELYILQSRAITAAFDNVREPVDISGRWVLFKPVAENFHEPLTPMTVDLFSRVLPPIGQFIRGRLYINVDQIHWLIPLKLSEAELGELLLLRGGIPRAGIDWRRLPASLGLLAVFYLSNGIFWHRTSNVRLETLSAFATLTRQVRDDPNYDPLTTFQRLFLGNRFFAPVSHQVFQANISAGRYFGLLGVLQALVKRFAPSLDSSVITRVCAGHEEMMSRQMVEQVRTLAERAREDVELRQTLLDKPAEQLAEALADLRPNHPFIVALQTFLADFGHRCTKEMDLITPRWREDPSAVLMMVRNYLKSDHPRPADPYGMRLAAQDELHQALGARWKRRLADYLVRRIRYYVTLREDTRHYHTMVFDAVRTKLKRIEQLLIDQGRLHCVDDIFFLHWNEAEALSTGRQTWQEVEPIIRERRQRYHRESRMLPEQSFNLQLPERPLRAGGAANELQGECACPGYAEGTVRVILDPTVSADLDPGDVLVAPYTDPAWTPLFPGAAAIIVEVGSYLSHAGTVAREYQIPCLVDVEACTRRLSTGQRVRVFASEGRIEVLE
ncbi:MAG: PEP-utilizing enzyme [Gammaproteobacteria bacterium]|nr:PEP-utilizing enzyme [Gammaproteobacteria bacterium]